MEERPPTREELPELLGIVRESGALDKALAYARDLVGEGIDQLSPLPETPYKQALIDLATYLAERAL